MGWTEEVHQSRVNESIRSARRDSQLRKKSAPVTISHNAGPAAFVLTAAAAGGFLLWKRYEQQLSKIQWRSLPIIKQFDDLINSNPAGRRLGGSKSSGAGAAAARPKVRAPASPALVQTNPLYSAGRGKPAGKPASSVNNTITPAAAAANAAAKRAAEQKTAAPAKPEGPLVPSSTDAAAAAARRATLNPVGSGSMSTSTAPGAATTAPAATSSPPGTGDEGDEDEGEEGDEEAGQAAGTSAAAGGTGAPKKKKKKKSRK